MMIIIIIITTTIIIIIIKIIIVIIIVITGDPALYHVLQGVSGRFAHSHLHAVMGPSGCGKTSLCTLLAGKLPRTRVSGMSAVHRLDAPDDHKRNSRSSSLHFGSILVLGDLLQKASSAGANGHAQVRPGTSISQSISQPTHPPRAH